MLIDSAVSRLPPFLTGGGRTAFGLHGGSRYAAALASENNRWRTRRASTSLPTSANQEDHVSMACFAARRLQAMSSKHGHILGIELLRCAGYRVSQAVAAARSRWSWRTDCARRVPAAASGARWPTDIERATACDRRRVVARVSTLPNLVPLWPLE